MDIYKSAPVVTMVAMRCRCASVLGRGDTHGVRACCPLLETRKLRRMLSTPAACTSCI